MAKFVMTYHGGDGEMPAEQAEIDAEMAKWGAWYGSMGAAVVDSGAPFSIHGAVAPDGSSADAPAALTGYTIVEVADLDAAKKFAESCPVLGHGATIQISECIDMGG